MSKRRHDLGAAFLSRAKSWIKRRDDNRIDVNTLVEKYKREAEAGRQAGRQPVPSQEAAQPSPAPPQAPPVGGDAAQAAQPGVVGVGDAAQEAAQPSPVLPEVWTECKAPNGRRYFHNTNTNETTWNIPKVLPHVWMESKAPDGSPYFYNKYTKETTWNRPTPTPVNAHGGKQVNAHYGRAGRRSESQES